MVAPIIWAFGMGVLALAGCGNGEVVTEEETPTPDGSVPPPKPSKDDAVDSPERHRYEPPDNFTMPQATNEGIFYHPFFTQEGVQTNLSHPRWFRCQEDQCRFVAGNKLLSFTTNPETLANENPIALTTVMDFAPEVDGTRTNIKDILIDGSLIYALYDGTRSGIAIRRLPPDNSEEMEAAPPNFSFSELEGMENYCPSRMVLFGATLWFSAANCRDWVNFGDGRITPLEQQADGSLEPSEQGPFVTSLKNPEALLAMDIGDGTLYLLSVASGLSFLNGEIFTESGVDVYSLTRKTPNPLIGQIPLGEAAAFGIYYNNFSVAFHGSLNQPNLYVTDLFRMVTDLLEDNSTESEEVLLLNDVPLSDASNPVRFLPPGLEIPDPENRELQSIFALDYNPELKTVLASYYHGRLVYIQLPYTTNPEGVVLEGGFGDISGHYHCNDATTENCGPVSFLPEGGAVALTGEPVSVTYVPVERLAQTQEE